MYCRKQFARKKRKQSLHNSELVTLTLFFIFAWQIKDAMVFFCFLRFTFTACTFLLILKTCESRSRYKDCHITDELIPFAKTVLCVTQIRIFQSLSTSELSGCYIVYPEKKKSTCLYSKSSQNQFEIGWLKIFTCYVHWSRK